MSISGSIKGYRTRVLRSVEDLDPATAGIASRCGASEFYYGYEFLRAYEREPIQPVHQVYYIETYDESGALVALTPCYVQGDPLRALGLGEGELALLSHVWHCSDTQVVTVDDDPAVAGAIVSTMRRIAAEAGLRRLGFINVPVGSSSAKALDRAGLPGIDLDTRYCMDLGAMGDWEGYLTALKQKARGEYRRQLRRAQDAGAEVVERQPSGEEDPESLRIFETLMARVGSAGYYSAERIAAFLRYTPTGARIVEVWLHGDLLAKAVVFIEPEKIHAWAGGWDRASDEARKLPFSSYYILMAGIIKLGLRLRIPRLEGGRRNPAFKIRFGMQPLPLQAFMADA